MSKKLSKALRTDLNEMAALLRSKGRGRDTILAHINPEEAALLKRRGGSGTINPETGIMEFEDGSFDWFSPSTWFGGGEVSSPTPEPASSQEYAMFGGDSAPEPIQEFSQTQAPSSPAESGGIGDWFSNLFGGAQPQAAPAATPQDFGSWQNYQEALTGVMPQQMTKEQAAGGFTDKTGATFDAQGNYIGQAPGFEMAAKPTVVSPEGTTFGGALDSGITDQQKKDLADKGIDWTKVVSSAIPSLLGTAGKFGLGYALTKPIQRTQTTAAQESAKLNKEIGALGAPTKAVGTQMLAQAEAGQMTPVQRRNLQALRAQQRQALSRAGITSGTAALQSEANIQRLANEYTSNNIQNALNMMQFGDKYVAQGIRAGYDANQQANQAANIFYQNLFRMLGGTSNPFGG